MSAKAIMSPQDADKLAKLCGMFGSDHVGERGSAAAKADALVRALGLTWYDVIGLNAPEADGWREPETPEEFIGVLLRHADLLSEWELNFVQSVRGRPKLSVKQIGVLDRIYERVRAFVRAA